MYVQHRGSNWVRQGDFRTINLNPIECAMLWIRVKLFDRIRPGGLIGIS